MFAQSSPLTSFITSREPESSVDRENLRDSRGDLERDYCQIVLCLHTTDERAGLQVRYVGISNPHQLSDSDSSH